jgi:Carboxypeptidase regulatory-like domain
LIPILGFRRVLLVAVATVTAVVLLGCASSSPPAQVGIVRGVAVDTFGNALPGIVVSLRASDGKVFQSVTTEEGGAYEFPAVPVGQYEVFSEFAGYTTVQPIAVKVTPSGLATPPKLVLQTPQDPGSSGPQ